MKTLAIIVISGAAGFALGWLLLSILIAGERADQCAACHLSRTLRERQP